MTDNDRTVTLRSGLSMPLVGIGTWRLEGEPGYRAVRHALRVGYRHIDTATMYGNEVEVGRALRDSGVPRDQVFITTKLPPERAGQERRTLTDSLRALGTDYIDLWLVHWPPRRRASVTTWQQFLAVRDEGLVRAVGVSNYSPGQIDELLDATNEAPEVNQIPWSPSRYDAKRLSEHRERDIVVEGYSPFRYENLDAPVLVEIAAAHGVTAAQVVLRWHIQHGIVAIPKSATPERIESNLDVFGFALTPDEMARIDALGSG
ncbi:MAG TPA: aldo/keto reductase [Micromonosporaceae bacterium]